MTRAIIKQDRIVKLTTSPNKGVEVGFLPSGVGLERLRWTGSAIIDLMDLNEMWVNITTRELHCKEYPNCQLVEMSYTDREKLIMDPDTKKLRVMTQDEILQPKREEYKARRRAAYPDKSEFNDAQVKINSGIPELESEGRQQMNDYIQKCLNVKTRFPKE